MKTFKVAFVFFVIFSTPYVQYAQGVDFSIGGGGITYQGELSRGDFFKDVFDVRLCGRAGLSVVPNRYFTVGVEYHIGSFHGHDSLSVDPLQVDRDLNFRSRVQEVSVYGEYHFLHNADLQSETDFSPYVSIGFSWFQFDPIATYGDTDYRLAAYGTEGQLLTNGRAYKNYSFSVPLGLGLKYHINRLFAVKGEVKGRYAFTDHIDDVSGVYPFPAIVDAKGEPLSDRRTEGASINRGDSRYNDGYISYTLSLLIHILPAYRKGVHCPKVEKPILEF